MLNKVFLLGRATETPELKVTPSGKAVTTFSLAVNRQGKDAGADFFSLVCWEKTAEFVSKYIQKGRQIAVEGRLQQRRYKDKNGNNREVVEVVASNVYFADSREGTEGENKRDVSYIPPEADYEELASDDELPF